MAPGFWLAISSVFIWCMMNRCQKTTISGAINGETFTMIAFTFVNDTDLLTFAMDGETTDILL